MKTKIKFKILSSLFSAIFIFTVFITTASAAGLIDSGAGNNSGYYIPASSSAGESISAPLYDETPFISPAVNIIRNMIELKKPALLNSEITFRPEEFEKILDVKKIKYITITKLPDFDEGVLTLGGSEILEGQTISRENIQYIRLIPYPNRIGTIKFHFKNTEDTTQNSSMKCIVSVLESLHFSPSANDVNITTQKNIPVFKSMDGNDPDDDDINYRIVKGPKNGFLEISNSSTGNFVYRPKNNFTGTDSFVYQIQDEYGNLSNLATVQIKVTKAASSVIFKDLDNHWAANSAIKAAAAGFIDADLQDPDLKFEPKTLMTRAAFVEMVMRAAKLDKNISEVYKTGLADDSDIPFRYKSYVTKAYELGVIKGIPTDTGLYFDPNSIITRAEAAVIVNNILKIPATNETGLIKPVFVDAVFIPEWAENDIAALNSCGIIKGDENGNVNPNGLLTKAQSVEMLCAMLDYNKNLKNSGGLFSFLFK
ncbi:MAG: S-layer homology domain-containing protein [Oscillospiraceae bacterium]|nr:S-layer homology domain-containing protein [Oscillospiraceae bacterium]